MPPKSPPADKPETEKPDEGRMPLATKPEKPDAKGFDDEDGGHADKSPVDKIRADVEPKTGALASVEALVRGLADEFKVAALLGQEEAHELAEDFAAKATDLARAALANVEEKFVAGTAERGYDAGLKLLADRGPEHNEHAVRSAVVHGMDEERARAMTHSGANT